MNLAQNITKESDPVRQKHYTTKKHWLVDFINIFWFILKLFLFQQQPESRCKRNVEVAAPVISNVKVVGNKATVILSGESDGASGYDYVISTDRDCITNKDYDAVNKN